MTSITAVVCCHAADPVPILTNLARQTRPPDEIILLISEPQQLPIFKGSQLRLEPDGGLPVWKGDPWEHFRVAGIPTRLLLVENRNDWGHAKRARGLELAACEWVGFFNDDDSYDAAYLEELGRIADEEGHEVGAIYCDWSEAGVPLAPCAFQSCSSTSGNFIVRTDVGRRAGYPVGHYAADGDFIEAVRRLVPIAKVPRVLYHHNRRYRVL